MKKIKEYRQHAAECRDMARIAPPSYRQQLQEIADTWDQLAEARGHQLEKFKRKAGEHLGRAVGGRIRPAEKR